MIVGDPDPLITPSWLQARISGPDVRVIDATWIPPFQTGCAPAREQYRVAHIPGAVHFDIDVVADPDSAFVHMLPDPVLFSSHVRKLGLGDDHQIVVYDNNGFLASARVWWMFRVAGHRDVRVLDGGLKAWRAADGDIDEELPPVPQARHYTARRHDCLVRDMTQMQALAGNDGVTILDARPNGRFMGIDPEPRAGLASGHIPGSVNIPATDLLDYGGRMKPAQELQAILGPYTDKPVVTSCGSGVSAAIVNLALARLGNRDAALYDGSWAEWAAHADNPVATRS